MTISNQLSSFIFITSQRADFYFDPEVKIFTHEWREENIHVSFKGDVEHSRRDCIIQHLSVKSTYGLFDHVENEDDLLAILL